MNIVVPAALILIVAAQAVAAQEVTLECKLKGIDANVVSMDFSPDDQLLVVGTQDGTIKLFDVASRELKATQSSNGDKLLQISFCPDGESIAAATLKGKLYFWDRNLSKELFTMAQSKIMCFCFDRNSKYMLIGRWNASLDVYNVDRKAKAKTINKEITTRSVAWSPNGKLIACGSWGDHVQVFDSKTNKEVLQLARHRKYFPPVTFSPDSKILAIGGAGDAGEVRGSDSDVLLWDLQEGKEHSRLKVQSQGAIGEEASQVTEIEYCPTGKLLAASDFDQTRVWDLETETVIFAFPQSMNDKGYREQSMAFSYNGKYLALSDDNEVSLWKLP